MKPIGKSLARLLAASGLTAELAAAESPAETLDAAVGAGERRLRA